MRVVRPDDDFLCGVMLERTPCHFGGHRLWFRCPIPGCFRRVKKLYVHRSGEGCRTCVGLDYATHRASRDELVRLRAEKIRRRLGWPQGFSIPMAADRDTCIGARSSGS